MLPRRHDISGLAVRTHGGFTLIELIMIMIIVGILAGVVAPLISRPVAAFIAESRRGALVDAAQVVLDRMSREVRLAVPNTVRVNGTGSVVEFLRSIDGGRYRADPPGTDYLNNNPADFDIIGNLSTCAALLPTAPTCAKESTCYVVIGNQGPGTGADAFNGDDIAPIQSCVSGGADDGVSDRINLSTAKVFNQPSPNQRFQIVDTPVTYLCDLSAGTLRRYDGYTITADQSNVDTDAELTAAGAASALMAQNVSSCQFSFDAGVTNLLSVALSVSENGESVTLYRKIRVENEP